VFNDDGLSERIISGSPIMERSRLGVALPTETVLALTCVQAFGQDGDRAIAIGVLTWFVTHLHECALCGRFTC